jgi:hypothetical protein
MVGPGPPSLSVKPISVDPDDISWYQIAEILDHNGPSGPKCRCLVRLEGFDATHDNWILRKHVTLEVITTYEQILTDIVKMYTCSNTSLGRKRKKRWFCFFYI